MEKQEAKFWWKIWKALVIAIEIFGSVLIAAILIELIFKLKIWPLIVIMGIVEILIFVIIISIGYRTNEFHDNFSDFEKEESKIN